jgi:hypothetical protein
LDVAHVAEHPTHDGVALFFHATMAYAILRHNGVPLGKMDYIGSLPTREG